ncbi:cytochrome P450 [Streptomyces sioyaensis]|uniref:cytochrome P450 n=1 Tax=Streptomyces sioyaensis TaxID=67364 RepID=UPI00369F7F99
MTQTEATAAKWLSDITVEELENDTLTVFSRLRQEAPIAFIPSIGSWVVSTWEWCSELSDDADNFVGGTSPAHERVFGLPHILGAEGQGHQLLRANIDPPLRPRAFASTLEETVRPIVRARLDTIRSRGCAELLAEYFEPISVRCVGDILGFTEIPDETLRRWFHALGDGFANGVALNHDGTFANPGGFETADQAKVEIREVVNGLAAVGKDVKGVVSSWLHHDMPPGETRPLDGLLPSLLILLSGGLREPGHLCGNTFLGLSTQPDQLERMKQDLSLIPKAIMEGLRWLSPIFSGTSRLSNGTVTFDGVTIEPGQTVWLSYGSANRDEREFDRAEVFDLGRPAHPHLAFGKGRHVCSGAAFGPQVARIALEELLRELPTVSLDPGKPVKEWGWIFHGPQELHATW